MRGATVTLQIFCCSLLALACSEGTVGDASVFDSGIFDAEEPGEDGGIPDGGPDGDVMLDVGVGDAGTRDAFFVDGGGGVCRQAIGWADPSVPLISTTTTSFHRDRFECSGFGGGATAPEQWVQARFPAPTHAIVRLGTEGWDAVLAARTATCAEAAEVACVDAPTVVELPAVAGSLFVGVEGFTAGEGPFVLSSQIGPALQVPPPEAICENAPEISLPVRRVAHDFGVPPGSAIEECGVATPIYLPFELTGAAPVSVRVEPQSGGDVALALLSGCGAPVACASSKGPGGAEVLRNVQLSAGRYAVAIGGGAAADAQSFRVFAAVGAECVEDADCDLGQVCSPSLACEPVRSGAALVQGPVPIPDDGILQLSLPVAAPAGRPGRVRLRLALDHPFPRDLVATLVGPGGRPMVRLRDRLDGALDSVYGKDRPADGPGSLFDFGLVETATGTWTLVVEDRAPSDEGIVTGVVLEVE